MNPRDNDYTMMLHPLFSAELVERGIDVRSAILAAGSRLKEIQENETTTVHEFLNTFSAEEATRLALLLFAVSSFRRSDLGLSSELSTYLSERSMTGPERYQLATCLTIMGTHARRAGELTLAISVLKRGLEVVKDLPIQAVTANLMHNLAISNLYAGNIENAIRWFEESSRSDYDLGRIVESESDRAYADKLACIVREAGESPVH